MKISEVSVVADNVQVKFSNDKEFVSYSLSSTNEIIYIVYSTRQGTYDYENVAFMYSNTGHVFKRGKFPEYLNPQELEKRALATANYIRGI